MVAEDGVDVEQKVRGFSVEPAGARLASPARTRRVGWRACSLTLCRPETPTVTVRDLDQSPVCNISFYRPLPIVNALRTFSYQND